MNYLTSRLAHLPVVPVQIPNSKKFDMWELWTCETTFVTNIFLRNIYLFYFENEQRAHVSVSTYMCYYSAPDSTNIFIPYLYM